MFSRKEGDTFKTSFLNKMCEFINHLSNKVQQTAISSREASLAKLKKQHQETSSLEPEESDCSSDLELEIAITTCHINNLKDKKTEAALLELRDLLNLSRKDSTPRKPSSCEKEAFLFIFDISQPLIQEENNDNRP